MTTDVGELFRAISTTEDALKILHQKREELMKDPPLQIMEATHLLHENVCKKSHGRDAYQCNFKIERSWTERTRKEWLERTCAHIGASKRSIDEYVDALRVVFAKA